VRPWGLADYVLEKHTVSRQTIDIRAGPSFVPVCTQVIGPQRVEPDDYHVDPVIFPGAAEDGCGRHDPEQQVSYTHL
jgi:hypothetical protein